MPRLDKKVLSRLSDEELREEALRRRRARAKRTTRTSDADGEAYARDILQFYANLELPVGASVAEIETAYTRLLAKYDPSKHASDPQKHEAAAKLVASLTRAYEGLLAHKSRGKTS